MSKKEFHKFPLVEVEWVDSCSQGRWGSLDNYDTNPTKCRSSGYLRHKDKKSIQLIQTHNEDKSILDSITIPRGCVTKIRLFK